MPAINTVNRDGLDSLHARRVGALAEAGITRTQLADMLGISRTWVWKVVAGERSGHAVECAVTHYTGKSHEWLWGRPAPKPTPEQAWRLRQRAKLRWTGDPDRPFESVRKNTEGA
ncbi:MAG: hypothetical protein BWY28_02161 [bacterium ADurb.Bin236]|nr:MAG: hypothetical protein BWY28_02161 [bacterium ADurb.Bin236]